ncbi:MAG: hypothetical protein JXX14_06055, partial [Deltaproteobacteria bacterium]|nr:hypothetical protein [Deltaproteobacteria bacterium]
HCSFIDSLLRGYDEQYFLLTRALRAFQTPVGCQSGDRFGYASEIAGIRAALLRARKARPRCRHRYIDRGTEDESAKMPDCCDCSKDSNRSPL